MSSAELLQPIPPAHDRGPLYFIALSGGIGSGKSTVARALRSLGAHIVDADELAREVLACGQPAYEAVLERFGADLADSKGVLNRQLLAQRAFSSSQGTADLNSITHPAIAALAHERLAQTDDGALAVYDVPLLTKAEDAASFDAVMMVTAPRSLRLARLEQRGLSRHEAELRMNRQISDADRRAIASIWIDNSGSLEDVKALTQQVALHWLTPLSQ